MAQVGVVSWSGTFAYILSRAELRGVRADNTPAETRLGDAPGVAFRQLSETAFRTDILTPQPSRQASVISGRALRLTAGGDDNLAAGTCLRTDRTVTLIARG